MLFKLAICVVFAAINIADSTDKDVKMDEITLSISPAVIFYGLTADLELQCSFTKDANSSVASVLSMYISHSVVTDKPVFNYVASVNVAEGHAHNITHDVSKITGRIKNNGRSYLSVSIDDPNSDNAGVYQCNVNGFDAAGNPVELTSIALITADQFDLNTLYKGVSEMKTVIQNQQTYLQTLLLRQDEMRDSFFYGPSNYSGHQYYITKRIHHFVYPEAQAICNFYGGYLAEIDNHDEFNFLRDWILILYTDRGRVWTGATDEGQEGVWVNKHGNKSLTSLFDWDPSSPRNNHGLNCQTYYYYPNNWYLTDYYCSYRDNNLNELRFICEVP